MTSVIASPSGPRSRASAFRRAYRAAAVILTNAFVLFLVLNAAAALYYAERGPLASRRRGAPLDPRLLAAYPGVPPERLQRFLAENVRSDAWEYEAFTEFRHRRQAGEFFHVGPYGFRDIQDQAAWPPEKDAVNVFVFGGSTTFGYGLADDETIPSFLQAELRRTGGGRRIAVYNFGRCGYVSTQERILFEQLAVLGIEPDVAVFLDGLNEFLFTDGGDPLYGWRSKSTEVVEALVSDAAKGGVSKPARDLASALPAVRLANGLLSRLSPQRASLFTPPDTAEGDLGRSVRRWLGNRELVEAIASRKLIHILYVWQPIPTYRYDRRTFLFFDARFHTAPRMIRGYPLMAAARREGSLPGVLWLADMQAGRHENLYVDPIHYTKSFSREIAAEIAKELVRRGAVEKKAGAAAAGS